MNVLPPSNRNTAVSRCLSVSLALFIFALTAFVHLAHNASDFRPTSCEPSSYRAENDARNTEDQQPCPACEIVKAFQTAQVILLFLLLYIVKKSDFHRYYKPESHSISIYGDQWVRGPPQPAFS